MSPRTGRILALFRAEMKAVARDRRAIVTSVVLPMAIMPAFLFLTSWKARSDAKTLAEATARYAVSGPHAETVRSALASVAGVAEVPAADPAQALEKGDIDVHVEAAAVIPVPGKADWREPVVPDAPGIRLHHRGDRDASRTGMRRVRDALREGRNRLRAERLRERGFPVPLEAVAVLVEEDIAPAARRAGLTLGRSLTVFALLLVLTGCSVVATDAVAGERERGTLETLLTTAMGRGEIVAAKHLATLAVAVAITVIQAANLFVYVGLAVFPMPEGWTAAVTPGVALFLLVLYLPLASLAAAVLLFVSGQVKSYKEAQLYFLPVFLVGMVLASASFLPGVVLRSAIVVVPVANLAVAAREILVGSYDWLMIGLAWLTTAGAAAWTARRSVALLSAESWIAGGTSDEVEARGGPPLFRRRVGRWFAVLWAVLLVTSGFTTRLDARGQVAVNLLVLFLGASLLMIRRYRLPPREVLALRKPHPAAWLAVAVGVPGGLLAANAFFRLASQVLPIPPGWMEEFTKALTLPGVPTWQLLLFVALVPGVVEEITFRGLLLYGLHRRLAPWSLVLVVSIVFGLFHMALFRILPTAFIGVLLTAATLLTGSIFPAMAWHTANNALALLLARDGVALETLSLAETMPGFILLAVSFWILWRTRRPYPDLR